MTLLDVGCGPGTITVELAARLRGPGGDGRVTAPTGAALDLARAEAAGRGQDNVGFAVADVHAPGFADDPFDVVHAHQVLQHVGDPVRALRRRRTGRTGVGRPGSTSS